MSKDVKDKGTTMARCGDLLREYALRVSAQL